MVGSCARASNMDASIMMLMDLKCTQSNSCLGKMTDISKYSRGPVFGSERVTFGDRATSVSFVMSVLLSAKFRSILFCFICKVQRGEKR